MYLAGLVLCDLVLGVLLAVPALAVCPPCLRNVDLRTKNCQPYFRLLCAFEPKSNPLACFDGFAAGNCVCNYRRQKGLEIEMPQNLEYA